MLKIYIHIHWTDVLVLLYTPLVNTLCQGRRSLLGDHHCLRRGRSPAVSTSLPPGVTRTVTPFAHVGAAVGIRICIVLAAALGYVDLTAPTVAAGKNFSLNLAT